MQIIIFTAKMMWKNAINRKSRLWLSGFLLVSLFVITPQERILSQLVSFSVIFPSVFLLTDWNGSAARKGIMTLITRSDGPKVVKTAEWSIPALVGAVISSLAVFAVSAPPPWQFLVAASLIATSFSLIFLVTEQYMKYAGRAILGLIWLVQIKEHTGRVTDLLLFTGYPAAVLSADLNTSSPHPDSYVLTSLIVMLLTASIYVYLLKRKS